MASLSDAITYTYRVHWKGSKNGEGALSNALDWTTGEGPTGTVLAEIDARWVSTRVEGFKSRGLTNATINRKLSALSRVLASAVAAGMLDARPPRFPFLKEKSGRTRTVTEDELQQLVNLSGIAYGKLWVFLFDTGLRVGEALSLTSADIDEKRRTVIIRESKSGSPRTVPLTLRALEAVKYSFPDTASQVNREWSAVRQQMGLTLDHEFVPHALRHTCATRLVKAGVPLPVVQRWMGHKNISVTMRYAHVGDAQVMQAAEALERA